MSRKKVLRPRTRKPGAMPGTLVFQGERNARSSRITLFDYDENKVDEQAIDAPEQCLPFKI